MSKRKSKWTKESVVAKEPHKVVGSDGKERKLGTWCVHKSGDVKLVLNPSGKVDKFMKEKASGVHCTNDGFIKRDKFGFPKELTAVDKAYRAGYCDHARDSAAAYKAKK